MDKNEVISNVLDKLFTEESQNYDWDVVFSTSYQFFEWNTDGLYIKICVHCALQKDGFYEVHNNEHFVTFKRGGFFGTILTSCKASSNDEIGKKIIDFANKVFEEWSTKVKSEQGGDGLSEKERENLKFLANYFGFSA